MSRKETVEEYEASISPALMKPFKPVKRCGSWYLHIEENPRRNYGSGIYENNSKQH